MYSVVFAEDEPEVRRAILQTVDWKALGFSIVGEADNGREAFELVQSKDPDLLITDIRMPFMDGLELAKAVRETNPIVKIVFLTGYSDFEYARSAIKLNVIEYLTKPISFGGFQNTLKSIKMRLDEEHRNLRDRESLMKSYYENIPIARYDFLVSLLNGVSFGRDLPQKLSKLGILLDGECCRLFTIYIDRKPEDATPEGDDSNVALSSLQSMACTIARKYVNCEMLCYLGYVVGILSDTRENLDVFMPVITKEIQQSIMKHFDFSIAIGVSDTYSDLGETRYAYVSSLSALDFRHIIDFGAIIYSSDLELPNEALHIFDGIHEQTFHSLVKSGEKDALQEYITHVFEELKNKRANLSDYQICIIEMFTALAKTAKTLIPDFDLNVANSLNLIYEVYRNSPLNEIEIWFTNLCHRMMEYISIKRQDNADNLAAQGLRYIHENFGNPALSLKLVSAELHVSPSYFSALFKKATGESFTNVLIKKRMEWARERVLFSNTKVFEIALMSGYTDQHYFSYSFKKYFGQSPLEMRQKWGEPSQSGGPNEKRAAEAR